MLVTLNGTDVVDPSRVIDTMSYEHPLYTPDSVAAQRRLPEINTGRVAFAPAAAPLTAAPAALEGALR